MSIEKKDIIDYISEENGKKVLSISDHLQWGSTSHLYMLQEKINMYLLVIENGLLTTYYPHATNGFLISLYLKLGEIEPGQVTRTNHNGKPVSVESPISNKKIEE